MTLTSRAQNAIASSIRSLEARKVKMSPAVQEQAYWALEALNAATMPIILAHAVARDMAEASK
jgi:hypothetical protein